MRISMGFFTSLRFFRLFLLSVAVLAFFPQTGLAKISLLAPFATSNRYPIVQVYGLPYAGDGSVVAPWQVEGRATLEIANTFSEEDDDGEFLDSESVFLDGEMYRLALAARLGLPHGLEVGCEIPLVMNSGGFLDGFIEGFHETFGFPNGNRDKYPQDKFSYKYTRNEQDLLDITNDTAGLGDIRLTASWQFLRGTKQVPFRAALHASLKLPTGDSDDLLGSGSTDMALAASAGWDFPVGSHRLAWYAQGGAMYMTDSDVLRELQEHWVGFGSLGLGWQPLDWLALKVQWDAHTKFYSGSDFTEVSHASAQLMLGGSLRLASNTALDIGVGEDLTINTAPDVIFHFSLRHLF